MPRTGGQSGYHVVVEPARSGTSAAAPDEPLRWWRLVGLVAVAAVLVFVGVAAAGVITSRRVAEREAINDALHVTDILAESVLEPALEDTLLSPDPSLSRAAVARLDPVVRTRLLTSTLVRVKVWSRDGRILYADEAQLIGTIFPLSEDLLDVLADPSTKARVSDLSRPENRFEGSSHAKMLEVYRPVWTPGGEALLFETYAPYDTVTSRTSQLWRAFGGIMLASLMLLLIAQAPLTWALVTRIRKAQAQREVLLARAVSASDQERRRIAGTLHDGAVQELAASAFLVAGAADRARTVGDESTARQLDLAATTVRSSIGGLRTLLVDIYPASLRTAGLAAALQDLVAPMLARDLDVTLEAPEVIDLPPHVEALVFRIAQECLRNVHRHADAEAVRVSLTLPTTGALLAILTIADDGVGFDPTTVLAAPLEGHFGLRLMADHTAAAGAGLSVRSAPGVGTEWRLEVPRP